jgi:hypothetical protein
MPIGSKKNNDLISLGSQTSEVVKAAKINDEMTL